MVTRLVRGRNCQVFFFESNFAFGLHSLPNGLEVVVYEGLIREKPSSKEEARQFLKGILKCYISIIYQLKIISSPSSSMVMLWTSNRHIFIFNASLHLRLFWKASSNCGICISYKPQNRIEKRRIRSCGGIDTITTLCVKSPLPQIPVSIRIVPLACQMILTITDHIKGQNNYYTSSHRSCWTAILKPIYYSRLFWPFLAILVRTYLIQSLNCGLVELQFFFLILFLGTVMLMGHI